MAEVCEKFNMVARQTVAAKLTMRSAAVSARHRRAYIVINKKDAINRARLQRLANAVYPNGGLEVLNMVDTILAGRPPQF